jgi:hypothetical protein
MRKLLALLFSLVSITGLTAGAAHSTAPAPATPAPVYAPFHITHPEPAPHPEAIANCSVWSSGRYYAADCNLYVPAKYLSYATCVLSYWPGTNRKDYGAYVAVPNTSHGECYSNEIASAVWRTQ